MKTTSIFCLFLLLLFAISCTNDRQTRLKIGDTMPSFVTTDIDGNQIDLESLRGNPVILRFWSTECKFCRADTPVFNYYFSNYKDKGLQVFYINTAQSEEDIRAFMKDLEIGFPVIRDADGVIAAKYHIKIQPLTIVLDPDHKLLAAILGGISKEQFDELLGPYVR